MADTNNNKKRSETAGKKHFERTNAELAAYVKELQKANEEIARSRRAALNMMEDAIHSKETLRINEGRMRSQKEAFQAAVNGAEMADSLNIIARRVTEETGARTAFYIADENRAFLHPVWGAGSMPDTYLQEIDGFVIGESSLACGLAVPTGKAVITADVAEEPLWQPWLSTAEKYHFRGCWSFPIKTRQNEAVGTFAMYFTEPRQATPHNVALADVVMQTAAVIISGYNAQRESERAKIALRQSEEKYRAIFNSINEGFTLLDIQFNEEGEAVDVIILDANPAQDRIDGVRALIGRRVKEILPEIEMKWIHRYANIAKTGEPAHFEDWSEANQRWYHVHASRVGGEGSTLVAAVYDDITQRKKNETVLKQSEQHFRNLVVASSDMVYKMSADWKQMYNLDGTNMLTDASSSTSSWMDMYIPEQEKQSMQNAINDALQHKKIFELKHQLFNPDRNVVWAQTRAIPVLDETGQITEWIAAARYC